MCGEHRSIVGIGVACQGSSPHVRGALVVARFIAVVSRIIPACAGSTHYDVPLEPEFGDHPRMCGEHATALAVALSSAGSSPHVRGAPLHAMRLSHA